MRHTSWHLMVVKVLAATTLPCVTGLACFLIIIIVPSNTCEYWWITLFTLFLFSNPYVGGCVAKIQEP